MLEQILQSTELASIVNVTSIVCQEKGKFGWEGEDGYQVFSTEKSESPVDIYFLMDTHNQNAFAHWVFENFVYLHYYFQIKQEFPSCKLLVYERKGYKSLFLENNGVNPCDIVDASEVDFQYQTLNKLPIEERQCKPNRVFFHPYGSLNSMNPQPYHRYHIQSYLQQIQFFYKN